jgi:hypothetical protein
MNMRDSNMPPSEAITTLRQLYAATSIYTNSAALNYDFRWMRPPDLLEHVGRRSQRSHK